MTLTLQIHIINEEPILAEVDNLPAPTDTLVIANNPRLRDGKDLRFLAANVTTLILPVSRLNFIQVMPSGSEERVIGFVRE